MEVKRTDPLLDTLLAGKPRILTEYHSKEILRSWGLPVPDCQLAESAADSIRLAETIGYPVALKVHSEKITHKSDVGGVKLGLVNAAAVSRAYAEIASSCAPVDAAFNVLVQPMLPAGIEVILGVSVDGQFGPVILFGLGGIYTELFNDVAFRLLPVDREQALEMIVSVTAARLFQGYRGKPGGDIQSLANLIVQLSDLVMHYPEITELDLNPVFVYPDGVCIADARIVIT
jgi:acyl-CoA synthetase (NDP forming)